MIRIKQKVNRKRYRIKTSSSELLAKHFFDIIEKGDLRYLLILKDYTKLPEYDQGLLLDAWDSIKNEHEKDSGTRNFTNSLQKTRFQLRENNKLVGMKACYLMIFINKNQALEGLIKLGINLKDGSLKSIKELDRKIKSLETKIRIHSIKNRKKDFKNPYYDIIYILESELKSFDESTLTVKKMDYLLNNLKERNKKLKETHGR